MLFMVEKMLKKETHIPSGSSTSLRPNKGPSPILSTCKALFTDDMPLITILTLMFAFLLMSRTKKCLFLLHPVMKMLEK